MEWFRTSKLVARRLRFPLFTDSIDLSSGETSTERFIKLFLP